MKISKSFIKKNKEYYKYIEEYDWVYVADNIKGLEAFFHRLRAFTIKRLIKKYGKGHAYLDAGCGTGLMLRFLPKGTVGLDINPRNIKRAKEHAPHAKLVLADIEKIPFKSQTFSTIICTEVLEHQPDPNPAIKEIFRVLKNHGVLIGSVPSQSPLWHMRFLSSTCPREEPFHKNFQKKELEKLFGKHRISLLKKSVFNMSYIFVVEKK
jgi:ubiquinone/menaquinone biosynthesis C-methylase UbiE